MPRFIKRASEKVGLPPGTLIHIGEKKIEKAKITIIDYDERQFREKDAKKIEECFPFRDSPTVTWINLDGIHDVDVIEKLGRHFNVHTLLSWKTLYIRDNAPKWRILGIISSSF